MNIKVLYFGVIADITGKQEDSFSEFASVKNLLNFLENRFPDLKRSKYQISVNQEIKKEEFIFNNNDEVALLPPFSGG